MFRLVLMLTDETIEVVEDVVGVEVWSANGKQFIRYSTMDSEEEIERNDFETISVSLKN